MEGRVRAKINFFLFASTATFFFHFFLVPLNFLALNLVQSLVTSTGRVEEGVHLFHVDVFFDRLLVQEGLLDQRVVLAQRVGLEQARISADDCLQVRLAFQFHVFVWLQFDAHVPAEVRIRISVVHTLTKVRSRKNWLNGVMGVFHQINY